MIASFDGEYFFLSNFYPAEITLNGRVYASTEHAYQAMKATNQEDHDYVASSETPGISKRRGKKIPIRDDWELVKIDIMRRVVEAKFDQHPDLMTKLKDTGDRLLVEGNTWGDRIWGQCPVGTGRNELGKILMSVRDDITRIL